MLVDMGYLTFKLAFGGYWIWEEENIKDIKLAAWDSHSLRVKDYLQYKQFRRESYSEEQEFVREFRKEVRQLSELPIVEIEGAEADDIIACYALFHGDPIIGIDKDYFQLPYVDYVYGHSFNTYSFDNLKIPKYLQELANKDFALYQMLYGDVADGIPRLLEKYSVGKQQVEDILKLYDDKNSLYDYLLNTFEDKIVTNAALVLLPYYGFLNEFSFFELFIFDNYYDVAYWDKFYERIANLL